MGIFENLKKIFTQPVGTDASSFLSFKVKCNRCEEEIEVKARKTSDISKVYEEEGPSGASYFLRKEILGKKCNNLIYVKLYFDPNFNIISKDISGGEFIE